MHGAGHFAIGGDAGDLYSSPNDPVFFLHHAMLDYVWWIWQALHPDHARTIARTITIGNKPPSRDATVEDLIQMKYLDIEAVQIKDVLSSLNGSPLCYIYVWSLVISSRMHWNAASKEKIGEVQTLSLVEEDILF